MELSEEEKKDILFQIDMQLYDEFNDKLAEMNDHLGDVYSLRDVEDVEKAEKEMERRLLREAVKSLQNTIKKQSYTNKKMRNKIKTVRKERNKLQKENDKKDKVIDEMYEYISYYDSKTFFDNTGWKDIMDYFYNKLEEEDE